MTKVFIGLTIAVLLLVFVALPLHFVFGSEPEPIPEDERVYANLIEGPDNGKDAPAGYYSPDGEDLFVHLGAHWVAGNQVVRTCEDAPGKPCTLVFAVGVKFTPGQAVFTYYNPLGVKIKPISTDNHAVVKLRGQIIAAHNKAKEADKKHQAGWVPKKMIDQVFADGRNDRFWNP